MTLQWPFTKPRSVCALLIRDGKVCRVTRRNKPHDYALVGGSIDSKDASAWDAMTREIFEEVGVEVVRAHMVFERVDPTDGGLAWCYIVDEWIGEPHQCEPGIGVSWGEPETLLAENCTFREYNRMLFTHLGMINEGPTQRYNQVDDPGQQLGEHHAGHDGSGREPGDDES